MADSIYGLTFELMKQLGIDENDPELVEKFERIEGILERAENIAADSAMFWRARSKEWAADAMRNVGLPDDFRHFGLSDAQELAKLYKRLSELVLARGSIMADHKPEKPSLVYGHPDTEQWSTIFKAAVDIHDFVQKERNR